MCLVTQDVPASARLSVSAFIVIVSVFLSACANPQQDRYDEAYAAVEREEQRRIQQSRAERGLYAEPSAQINPAPLSSSGGAGNPVIDPQQDPRTDDSERSDMPEASKAQLLILEKMISDDVSSSSKAWWTQRYQSPSSSGIQCLVSSQALDIGGGEQITRAQLVLTEKAIYLSSDAQIDRNAPIVSLRIDTNLPFVFERYMSDSVAAIRKSYTTILNELLSGNFVTVSAVFVTANGVPNVQILEFSLTDFISAYAQVDSC